MDDSPGDLRGLLRQTKSNIDLPLDRMLAYFSQTNIRSAVISKKWVDMFSSELLDRR